MSKRTKIIKTPTLKALADHTNKLVPDIYLISIKRPSNMTEEQCIYKIRNALFDSVQEFEDIKVRS